jgi:hypothetical protein
MQKGNLLVSALGHPMLSRRRKFFFVGLSVLGALALLLTASCWFFGIGAKQDAIGYYCMVREHFHPVCKALAFRRFGRGDPLKKLTDAYPPVRVEEFPPYKVLRYNEPGDFNSLVVIVKDDVLASASSASCMWEHHFFIMPTNEEAVADFEYNRYVREQRDKSRLKSAAKTDRPAR